MRRPHFMDLPTDDPVHVRVDSWRPRRSRLHVALLCLAVSAAIAVPWLLILWAVGLIQI